MDYEKEVITAIQESIAMKEKLKEMAATIVKIADLIIIAYKHEKKVLIFGNGGSAADAQHIAAELVGKFFLERKALPAIALNVNTSILTAIGNDYGYDAVFRRQLEAQMQPGDVVIGISTSGNSVNVIQALEYAKAHGGKTIGFVGEKPCKMDTLVEINLKIPSESTPRIQEGHITVGHIICYLVEKALFGKKE